MLSRLKKKNKYSAIFYDNLDRINCIKNEIFLFEHNSTDVVASSRASNVRGGVTRTF